MIVEPGDVIAVLALVIPALGWFFKLGPRVDQMDKAIERQEKGWISLNSRVDEMRDEVTVIHTKDEERWKPLQRTLDKFSDKLEKIADQFSARMVERDKSMADLTQAMNVLAAKVQLMEQELKTMRRHG